MEKYVDKEDRKLVLFGAGEFGRKWLERLGKESVWGVSDTDPEKIGTDFYGKKVMDPDELLNNNSEIKIYPAASDRFRGAIKQFLIQKGLGECIIDNPYHPRILRTGGGHLDPDCIFEGENYVGTSSVIQNCRIGYGTYIASNGWYLGTKIGRYCAIGMRSGVIKGQHPTRDFVSIHPSFFSVNHAHTMLSYVDDNRFDEKKTTQNGFTVEIGNDVWIGQNAWIMEGITIGDGAIIAAGAVVTKNVEPYDIVGGIPAKTIRKRFNEAEIEFLLKLKWWDRSEKWIRKNAQYFNNIQGLMSHIKDNEGEKY